MSKESPSDPLEFVRNMWSGMGFTLPGMVTPTLDVDELEQRIADMKAVEGWLRMNLSMLQGSIQGLEVQAATLTTIRTMGEAVTHHAQEAQTGEGGGLANPFSATALWPWMQATGTEAAPADEPEADAPEVDAAASTDETTPNESAATAAGANAAEAFASAASAASNAALWPWQMLSAEAEKTAKAAPVKKSPAKKAPAKKSAASTKAKPAAAGGTAKRTTGTSAKKRAPAKKS